MRSDAYIKVTCDECQAAEIEIELTALAGKGWDERNVTRKLARSEWKTVGEKDYCETCALDNQEEADEG